jgi:hypothetical protein
VPVSFEVIHGLVRLLAVELRQGVGEEAVEPPAELIGAGVGIGTVQQDPAVPVDLPGRCPDVKALIQSRAPFCPADQLWLAGVECVGLEWVPHGGSLDLGSRQWTASADHPDWCRQSRP